MVAEAEIGRAGRVHAFFHPTAILVACLFAQIQRTVASIERDDHGLVLAVAYVG